MANVLEKRMIYSLQFSNRLLRFNQLKNTLSQRFFGRRVNYNRPFIFQFGWLTITGAFVSGVGAIYWLNTKRSKILRTPFLLSAASKDEEVGEGKKDLTLKRMRFEEYASYAYGGKLLMSPKDFLDSLIDKKDDARKARKTLTKLDVDRILKSTRKLPKHKEDLFTYMGDNGIITYPEYLFLLTLLTKSSHGLHVAFRMLDLDGNATLGRTEFQELEKMLNKKTSAKSLHETPTSSESAALTNTSLLIYFFGVSGRGQLTFNDMLRFTRNLQKEFWKQEFVVISGNRDVIDSEQFAKLLLQSTHLNEQDIKEYIGRLKSRQGTRISVSLQDYIKFGEFLNHLEEFSISLKIYNVANQPVTQEEFKRAVRISTGGVLGDHIVNTIFQLFDIDGDGKLSQKEFLGLMKDRVKKRFTAEDDTRGILGSFVNCMKEELVN